MGKYLDFYKKCIRTGRTKDDPTTYTYGGLCSIVIGYDVQMFFSPTAGDLRTLSQEGYDPNYWASGMSPEDCLKDGVEFQFTPLRQNIVLFLAAIHGEDFNELKK